MSVKYRYGHKPGRRRRTRVLIVLAVSFIVLVIIGGLIVLDIYRNRSRTQEGKTLTVVQTYGDNLQKLSIDEPTFVMELPGDWKEISRINNTAEHSITWQATKKNEDNRYLTVYVDVIPRTKAINRLVPIMVSGVSISADTVSDNCATFTKGGSLLASEAIDARETPAKWNQIDFICNLPRVFDNEVGTGSTEGINVVTITGPKAGKHRYFFLYTDRNVQPDYTIFYNALKSFNAK